MICKFCGAEYPNDAKVCFHCHSENPLMTQKRKSDVLHAFDVEAKQMKKELPKKTVKKAHKILVIVIAGIVVMLFTFGAIFIGVAKSKEKVAFEMMQMHLSKMENLFQSGDMDALMEYYYEMKDRDYVYDKYGQIFDVGYFDRRWVYDRYEEYKRHTETYYVTDRKEDYMRFREDYLYWVLDSGRDSLQNMYLYANDRVILGNEEILIQWKDEMETFFVNEVGLSEEELLYLRTFNADGQEEELLRDMARMIIERDDSTR